MKVQLRLFRDDGAVLEDVTFEAYVGMSRTFEEPIIADDLWYSGYEFKAHFVEDKPGGGVEAASVPEVGK